MLDYSLRLIALNTTLDNVEFSKFKEGHNSVKIQVRVMGLQK
jgi:hypothetical protein